MKSFVWAHREGGAKVTIQDNPLRFPFTPGLEYRFLTHLRNQKGSKMVTEFQFLWFLRWERAFSLFHRLGIPIAFAWETFIGICYMVSKERRCLYRQLIRLETALYLVAVSIILSFPLKFYFPICFTSVCITIYCSFGPKKYLHEYIYFICIFFSFGFLLL